MNRTIESIQSQLLGLFENIEGIAISEEELKWSLPAFNRTLDRKEGINLY